LDRLGGVNEVDERIRFGVIERLDDSRGLAPREDELLDLFADWDLLGAEDELRFDVFLVSGEIDILFRFDRFLLCEVDEELLRE